MELVTKVGQPAHLGAVSWPDHPVTLVSARPVVVHNSARAVVTVRLCTQRRSSGVGAVRGSLDRWCSAVEAVDGQAYRIPGRVGRASSSLAVTVLPRQRGAVRIRGVEVSYRDGWRRGTETTGAFMDVRAVRSLR